MQRNVLYNLKKKGTAILHPSAELQNPFEVVFSGRVSILTECRLNNLIIVSLDFQLRVYSQIIFRLLCLRFLYISQKARSIRYSLLLESIGFEVHVI